MLSEATDQKPENKSPTLAAGLLFSGQCFLLRLSVMRDKKDIATFDLPGVEAATAPDLATVGPCDAAPPRKPRTRRTPLKQEQLQLLDETDASGLPVWRRDDTLDLTGLPVWAPA